MRIKVQKRGTRCASLLMGGATTVLRDIDDMARPRGDVIEDPRCAHAKTLRCLTRERNPPIFHH